MRATVEMSATPALLPPLSLLSDRDPGGPETARLPWWVTGEIAKRGQTEMSLPADLEAEFLCVPPAPFPARVDAPDGLLVRLAAMLRMALVLNRTPAQA